MSAPRLARPRRFLLAAVSILLAAGAPVGAQQPKLAVAPELRVDVLGGHGTSVQGGAGVQIPAGAYVRVGVIAAAGSRWRDGSSRTDGRVDVLARFLIDPFRQSEWGLSAGGGVTLSAMSGDRVRPHLLVAVDLEGPCTLHGLSPAFQVGLGGGVRAGFGLRWSGRVTR
ncbi:MAG: hypothetical protein ABI601_03995 [bacterium]